MNFMDRAIRDCRRRAKGEPENLHLQQQVDHLNQIIPEAQPWGYEKGWADGWKGWVVAFLLVGAVFCCGLHQARADGFEHPVQMTIQQPAQDRMSWPEGVTAIGLFLAGAGGLAAWTRRNR